MPRHSLRWFSLVLVIFIAGGFVWYKMRPEEIEVTVAPGDTWHGRKISGKHEGRYIECLP